MDPKLLETSFRPGLSFKKGCIKFRVMVAFFYSTHQVDSYKTPEQS